MVFIFVDISKNCRQRNRLDEYLNNNQMNKIEGEANDLFLNVIIRMESKCKVEMTSNHSHFYYIEEPENYLLKIFRFIFNFI